MNQKEFNLLANLNASIADVRHETGTGNGVTFTLVSGDTQLEAARGLVARGYLFALADTDDRLEFQIG